jgi:hypothetical protein
MCQWCLDNLEFKEWTIIIFLIQQWLTF